MLKGIRIYTTDDCWRKILTDLGADIVGQSILADIDFDSIQLPEKMSVMELKSFILNFIDKNQKEILNKIFNQSVVLSSLQMQIVILLFKTDGLSLIDLRNMLGYAPDVSTHAVDTAIYQLRKKYGHDFIKNENGKYFIGKL